MDRIKFTLVMSLILVFAGQVLAGSTGGWAINVGGGFSRVEMTEDVRYHDIRGNSQTERIYANTNVYNIYLELAYKLYPNLEISGGYQYHFNGNEIKRSMNFTFEDDYDNRKPRAEDDLAKPLEASFLMPYISARYNIGISNLGLYSKVSLGYGLGEITDYSDTSTRSYFRGHGIGVITSLGKEFVLNTRVSGNFELGYRYIRTGKLENSSGYPSYINERLDFSGLYAQSSFSFSL